MTSIITLTINPSIDVSASVECVAPIHKLRCATVRHDPGGGGVNVARVMKRFGADVIGIYPAGGALGELLRHLIDREAVPTLIVPIAEETRQNFNILEQSSARQYRFVLPGPRLTTEEWQTCLNASASLSEGSRFMVASGSLPPGVPSDFYSRVAVVAKRSGAKVVIDTSGAPLRAAVDAGVYLIKPSLRELRELTHRQLEREPDCIAICRGLIESGQVEIIALTLSDEGALLVTRDRVLRARAIPVPASPVSVVGAGDSFLGAMIWSLDRGHALDEAFRYGAAAGSAALLRPGTGLCRREDVERLLRDVQLEAI
jgi:6-phosphofructokinase 2